MLVLFVFNSNRTIQNKTTTNKNEQTYIRQNKQTRTQNKTKHTTDMNIQETQNKYK